MVCNPAVTSTADNRRTLSSRLTDLRHGKLVKYCTDCIAFAIWRMYWVQLALQDTSLIHDSEMLSCLNMAVWRYNAAPPLWGGGGGGGGGGSEGRGGPLWLVSY